MAKGEPYSRVKERARYMLFEHCCSNCPCLAGQRLAEVVNRLVETAPTQTLDALCEVLDPDKEGAS